MCFVTITHLFIQPEEYVVERPFGNAYIILFLRYIHFTYQYVWVCDVFLSYILDILTN